MIKNIIKSEIIIMHFTGKYRSAAHNLCKLRYKTPKEIPVVFNNGSEYGYHFIIIELAEELKTSKYKLKFIGSFRFMQS